MENLNQNTADVKSLINTVINNSAKYRNCYFWTPFGNAATRRNREFEIEFEFDLDGEKISVEQSLRISCKNFYFKTDVRRDGKRSNITILRKVVAQA